MNVLICRFINALNRATGKLYINLIFMMDWPSKKISLKYVTGSFQYGCHFICKEGRYILNRS